MKALSRTSLVKKYEDVTKLILDTEFKEIQIVNESDNAKPVWYQFSPTDNPEEQFRNFIKQVLQDRGNFKIISQQSKVSDKMVPVIIDLYSTNPSEETKKEGLPEQTIRIKGSKPITLATGLYFGLLFDEVNNEQLELF